MTSTVGWIRQSARIATFGFVLTTLSGCQDGEFIFANTSAGGDNAQLQAKSSAKSSKRVERDVEAPEVFQATEAGLWDGRPSLGGVWVAHPDVTDPERVIIRNSSNGKFVIGALFRRERDIPGPRLQVSSDAASSLGMLAGAPVELSVTALRKEEVAPEVEETPAEAPAEGALEAPDEIKETELAAAAGAAIAAAPKPDAKPATPAAKPTAAPKVSSLSEPYIQIGIFSVKANAERVVKQMRGGGMIPILREQSLNGKKFWRVIVGPAQNKSERNALLKQIKAEGFTDAYPVKN